jgi:hypothetical protein
VLRWRKILTGSAEGDGAPVEIGRVIKMSKSKKNVVDPDDIIAQYGADAVRWFMLSDSPPERDLPWSEAGIEGCARFVQRLWRLFGQIDGRRRRARTRRSTASCTRRSPGREGHRGARLQQGSGADLRTDQRGRKGGAFRASRSPRSVLLPCWSRR